VARKILLVDPDVAALASLAGALRRRGLTVQIANGTPMACERAKTTRFDAVLAWHALADSSSETLGLLDALAVETGRVPPFFLIVADAAAATQKENVLRSDVEGIFARLAQVPLAVPTPPPPFAAEPTEVPSPAPPPVAPARSPSRSSASPARASRPAVESSLPPSTLTGLLSHTPLRDLLLALSVERRTGTLMVTTAQGAGELRLHDGELVDAVYMRLEGVKAVARLLGEMEGTFQFLPRTPPVMRRMNVAVPELLRACEDQVLRTREARAHLAHLEKMVLFASDGPSSSSSSGTSSGTLSDLARSVLTRLRTPATIDEVLEEMSAPDADLLEAIAELDAAGRVKLLSHESERVPLVNVDGLPGMRAHAARAKAPGFEGASRVVFAGTPGRLAVVAHSALSLADSVPPGESAPSVPVPHLMASVRLGDDVSVDLVALPLVPAYGPLWPMTLAGAAIVVRLDDAAAEALAEACDAAEVPIVDASVIVPNFDEGNAALVASAVRAALEGVTA
jgi:CheY-like chemotaxis protein